MLKYAAITLMLFTALPVSVSARVMHPPVVIPERVCSKADLANHLFKHTYGATWAPMGATATQDYLAFNNSHSVVGHFSPDTSLDQIRERMASLIQKIAPTTRSPYDTYARPYKINPHQCFIATGNVGNPYNVESGNLILWGGSLLSSQIYQPVPGDI